MERRCRVCATPNPAHANVCCYCGHALEPSAAEAPPSQPDVALRLDRLPPAPSATRPAEPVPKTDLELPQTPILRLNPLPPMPAETDRRRVLRLSPLPPPRAARRDPTTRAVAAILLGGLAVVGLVLAAAVGGPALQQARQAVLDRIVQQELRALRQAESTFQGRRGGGQVGTLQELSAAGCTKLGADGISRKSGYRFDAELARPDKYTIYGFPPREPGRVWSIDQTGALHDYPYAKSKKELMLRKAMPPSDEPEHDTL